MMMDTKNEDKPFTRHPNFKHEILCAVNWNGLCAIMCQCHCHLYGEPTSTYGTAFGVFYGTLSGDPDKWNG